MEVFDPFKNVDLSSIGKYMIAELFIGIVIGIIVKYLVKSKANQASDVRVFPVTEYSSRHFGRNFPRGAFDLFKLPPEFVIVQYSGDEIICEDFFTFLGNSTKAEYQNSQYHRHSSSALSSPVYLLTVVIPIVFGFFPALLPLIEKIGTPLPISGIIWLFVTSSVPAES